MLGVKIHYKPKFDKKPILIAALPDMGNVAGLCLNFLINKIDTKIFAEIYSFWPPFVTYKKGIINYLQSSYKFYENSQYNIILFTGDFNPTDPRRLYELCYEVLKIAEMFNVKLLYSLGASLKPINTIEKLVYAGVNKPEMVNVLNELNLPILEDKDR